MAAAATAQVATHPSHWDEELGRLVETAPSLPRSARIAVRRVLTSLLHEPATDAAAAGDIRRVLAALEQALYVHR
ncbi:MAG TPA: hypothetical protein VGQ15_01080 [Gaiellaceae bacterium]|jgi:hypothetical protein|nr:hypothetical protein [Gaiellaceae bacterium]